MVMSRAKLWDARLALTEDQRVRGGQFFVAGRVLLHALAVAPGIFNFQSDVLHGPQGAEKWLHGHLLSHQEFLIFNLMCFMGHRVLKNGCMGTCCRTRNF